MLISRNNDKL